MLLGGQAQTEIAVAQAEVGLGLAEGRGVKARFAENPFVDAAEIQHGSYQDRYAQTTKTSGYTVPDFEKIAVAYGIKAATIPSYRELKDYKEWFTDNEPCLINMSIDPDTLLIPKIKWETGLIMPLLNDELNAKAMSLLNFD